MCIFAIINHIFTSFFAVQIHDLSYIHLRKLERVLHCTHAHNLNTTYLRRTLNESKTAHGRTRKVKCCVKSHEPEINLQKTFVLSSKFCSVTYLDFFHVCTIYDGISNIKVPGTII